MSKPTLKTPRKQFSFLSSGLQDIKYMHVSVSTKFFSKYAYVHLARIGYIYVSSLHPVSVAKNISLLLKLESHVLH